MKIKLDSIAFAYEGAAPLIKGIGLSADSGEVVLITGGSGSGKSTLLKICAGLIEPTSGDVAIDGLRFWSLSEMERNDIRRRMGFDFQEGALIANMTISGNLALPLRYHGELTEPEIKRTIGGWLDRMSLSDYANLLPAALSTGLRRRASLARAMLCGRDAFFFDDPAQVADDVYRGAFGEVVREKKRGGAAIFIAAGDASYLADLVDKRIEI